MGITKAYTTRVGSGPFPTELTDEVGGMAPGAWKRIRCHDRPPAAAGGLTVSWSDMRRGSTAFFSRGHEIGCVGRPERVEDLHGLPVNGKLHRDMPSDLLALTNASRCMNASVGGAPPQPALPRIRNCRRKRSGISRGSKNWPSVELI